MADAPWNDSRLAHDPSTYDDGSDLPEPEAMNQLISKPAVDHGGHMNDVFDRYFDDYLNSESRDGWWDSYYDEEVDDDDDDEDSDSSDLLDACKDELLDSLFSGESLIESFHWDCLDSVYLGCLDPEDFGFDPNPRTKMTPGYSREVAIDDGDSQATLISKPAICRWLESQSGRPWDEIRAEALSQHKSRHGDGDRVGRKIRMLEEYFDMGGYLTVYLGPGRYENRTQRFVVVEGILVDRTPSIGGTPRKKMFPTSRHKGPQWAKNDPSWKESKRAIKGRKNRWANWYGDEAEYAQPDLSDIPEPDPDQSLFDDGWGYEPLIGELPLMDGVSEYDAEIEEEAYQEELRDRADEAVQAYYDSSTFRYVFFNEERRTELERCFQRRARWEEYETVDLDPYQDFVDNWELSDTLERERDGSTLPDGFGFPSTSNYPWKATDDDVLLWYLALKKMKGLIDLETVDPVIPDSSSMESLWDEEHLRDLFPPSDVAPLFSTTPSVC